MKRVNKSFDTRYIFKWPSAHAISTTKIHCYMSESLDWRDSQRHDSNHDKKSVFKRFKAKCFQSKPGHLSVNSYKTEELRLFHLYKINK